MHQRTVVGIGELLWDCFRDAKRPGGAPANVAYHAGQLGMAGVVVSRVGRDPPGDALLQELADRGVTDEAIQRDDGHPTGRVTVDTTQADHPVYTIHEDVAWDYIEFDAVAGDVTRRASAICFGTLAQRSSTSRATIRRVLECTKDPLLVYDVNLRPPWYERSIIEHSLRQCHVAKLNDEEIRVLAQILHLGAADVEGGATALRERFDLQVVCITRGNRGCYAASAYERVDVPGSPIDVVDTVGAGDAFTAAFVCGWLLNWSLDKAARFANEVGAIVAGHQGAMPNLQSELQRLRHRLQ